MNNREDRPEVKMAELSKRIGAIESQLENILETLVRYATKSKTLEDQVHELELALNIVIKKLEKAERKLKLDPESIEAERVIDKELFGVAE